MGAVVRRTTAALRIQIIKRGARGVAQRVAAKAVRVESISEHAGQRHAARLLLRRACCVPNHIRMNATSASKLCSVDTADQRRESHSHSSHRCTATEFCSGDAWESEFEAIPADYSAGHD
jgi:hypothetical protein